MHAPPPKKKKEGTKNIKTNIELRGASPRIARIVNGLEAWICKSERFHTFGVRFYAPGEISPGDSFPVDHDGIFTAVEKL